MKLGAQLYSLRNYVQTRKDTQMLFKACKSMGYDNLQFSGKSIETDEDARFLRDAAKEAQIPIVVANFDAKAIMEQPETVIHLAQTIGVYSVMVGVTPKEYRKDRFTVSEFLEKMAAPTQRLLDAGIHLAYHNHDYEFRPLEDGCRMMDEYLERCPQWLFMLDICWAKHAGADVSALIDRIGAKRLRHVHFKDMSGTDQKGRPVFCPCGSGLMELAPLAEKCKEIGVTDILVEQDNAATLPDPLGEMQQSCKYMRKLLGKEA